MEKKEIKISVIVLTKNEEEVISNCLKSVEWADEIVVVDHNSIDSTLDIVKKSGVKKIIKASENSSFSDRRNLGAKEASSEWLFYVDPDERVTSELHDEVLKTIQQFNNSTIHHDFSAYAIPRENIRLTKPLYHGGWWPDYVLRLIKKDKLIRWEGDLHEQPKINGEIGKLKSQFIHLSHRGSLEHKVATTIKWSKIEAQEMFKAGHPPMNISRFVSAMVREFYKRMIIFQGYRDGLEGIFEVYYQVFSVFISYSRLWATQLKQNENKE